ncbi:MAG: S46 family peptidase, partial [Planctomycetota bacterium]
MSQQKFKFVLMALLFCLFQLAKAGSDEGMYPVSEIEKLNLAEKGLELTAKQIFDSESVCLVDGICRVNGCTGSFVSPSGLIITNHHCAYRAIQSVSTTENDYLADGFQAKNLSDEIPAPGYTVRVTESFEDVSKLVLSVVTEGLSFSERTAVIDRRTKEIEKRAEENHPGMRAEVAEMFAGKTYVLFLYTYIKDVRLVFAPPSSIGNFGGDVDNWEWPRHTGDFSFMRAYVAPDGSSAEYSAENVPYRPKRHIQVAMEGANEGEFVMILGYPGRTARHKTASFLSFEQDFRLPNVVENYGRQMATMTAASDKDRSVALKLLSRMRSLANVEKRSRGQLKGLKRASIVQKRKITENELQAYIDQDPARKSKYGDVLPSINSVYQNLLKDAQSNANFTQVRSACQMARIAFTIFDAANEKEKPDLERESAYMDRNMDQTRQRLFLAQKDLDIETDKLMLKNAVAELNKTSDLIGPLEDRDIDALFSNSNLHDSEFLESCFDMTIEQLNQSS